jgi:UDPglucose 6-dehydrogenase
MNIGILGVGKLGLVYALSFERNGLTVWASSYKKEYVESLQQKKTDHLTEPAIANLLIDSKNINFTIDNHEVIDHCDIMYVMVATPSLPNGDYDVSAIGEVINDIINHAGPVEDKILVVGSTVNPGDCARFQSLLTPRGVHVVYSPTFAAQGTVLRDIEDPVGLMLGTNNDTVAERCNQIFRSIIPEDTPTYQMSTTGAEILKIAANCHGTMRINYINTVGQILIKSGLEDDIDAANQYLSGVSVKKAPIRFGFGYGGPCFPRDNQAFNNTAERLGIKNTFAKLNDQLNQDHIQFLTEYFLSSNTQEADFYFPYISYKPGVKIFEESHQLAVCKNLLQQGANVFVEPTEFLSQDIMKELKDHWGNQINFETLDSLEKRQHSVFKITL